MFPECNFVYLWIACKATAVVAMLLPSISPTRWSQVFSSSVPNQLSIVLELCLNASLVYNLSDGHKLYNYAHLCTSLLLTVIILRLRKILRDSASHLDEMTKMSTLCEHHLQRSQYYERRMLAVYAELVEIQQRFA